MTKLPILNTSQPRACVRTHTSFIARSSRLMALCKFLAKKDGSILPAVHMCGNSFLSRKEVERVNEGLKRVLGDTNQDKKLAIQFFPDFGASSILEDVMASYTTFDFTS